MRKVHVLQQSTTNIYFFDEQKNTICHEYFTGKKNIFMKIFEEGN